MQGHPGLVTRCLPTVHSFPGPSFLICRPRIRQKFSTDLQDFSSPSPNPGAPRAHLGKACLVGVWAAGFCSLGMSLVTVGLHSPSQFSCLGSDSGPAWGGLDQPWPGRSSRERLRHHRGRMGGSRKLIWHRGSGWSNKTDRGLLSPGTCVCLSVLLPADGGKRLTEVLVNAFLSLDWRWHRWREEKRSPSIFTLLYPSQLRHPCQCWVSSSQPWCPLTRDGSETPGEAPGGLLS